jgi:transposase-like protein
MEKLAICTDAGKGLMTVVELVFPQADKRECFRHLMQNFIKRFHGNSYRGMYPAARAYRQTECDRHIGPILYSDPEVITWLNRDHEFKWMRSTFDPDIKCDYINNNLAECFNNWVKDHKDLPVVQLADKIRELIMVLWEKKEENWWQTLWNYLASYSTSIEYKV